jgi:hypothetical protein
VSSQYARGKAWTNVRPGSLGAHNIVSAWNWSTGQYDYYQIPKPLAPSYGDEVKPPQPGVSLAGLGEDPDQSARPIPFGARKVGSGSRALGDIASPQSTSVGPAAWVGVAIAIAVPVAILFVTVNLRDWLGGRSESEQLVEGD